MKIYEYPPVKKGERIYLDFQDEEAYYEIVSVYPEYGVYTQYRSASGRISNVHVSLKDICEIKGRAYEDK